MMDTAVPLEWELGDADLQLQEYRARKAAREAARRQSRLSHAPTRTDEEAYTASLLQRGFSKSVPASASSSRSSRSRSSTLSRREEDDPLADFGLAETAAAGLARSASASTAGSQQQQARRVSHASAPPETASTAGGLSRSASGQLAADGLPAAAPLLSRSPSSRTRPPQTPVLHISRHPSIPSSPRTADRRIDPSSPPRVPFSPDAGGRSRHVSAHIFGRPASPTGSIVIHEQEGPDDEDEDEDLQSQRDQHGDGQAEGPAGSHTPARSNSAASSAHTAAPSIVTTPADAVSEAPSFTSSSLAHSLSTASLPRSISQALATSTSTRRGGAGRDDSAYGIPSRVLIDGQYIDITDLDILEQVEMIRKAEAQAAAEKRRKANEREQGAGEGRWSARQELEISHFTELSDIAERTECSTNSRRTSLAPTAIASSASSAQLPLSPPSLPLSPSVRSSTSEIYKTAPASTITAAAGRAISVAERIKLRYQAQGASGPAERQTAGGGRKIASVGETVYHSTSPRRSRSSRQQPDEASLHAKAASAPSLALSEMSYNSQTSAYIPKLPKKPTVSPMASLVSLASAGEAKSVASSGTRVHPLSEAASQQERSASPTKRALSPVVAARLAAFGSPVMDGSRPPSLAGSAGVRERARSFGSHSTSTSMDKMSRKGKGHQASASEYYAPPVPMPTSRSAGELVKLYESRSSTPGAAASAGNSPVKDWLRRVPLPTDSRPISPVPSQPSLRSSVVRSAHSDAATSPSIPSSRSAPSLLSSSASVREAPLSPRRVASGHTKDATDVPAPSRQAVQASLSGKKLEYAFPELGMDADDERVAHHGSVYWLNSSSELHPAFWQPCRAVLVQPSRANRLSAEQLPPNDKRLRALKLDHELVISWPGRKSGLLHVRKFNLSDLRAAVSVRGRNAHQDVGVAPGDDGESEAAGREEMDKMHVWELQWDGRTHRFAMSTAEGRMRWLSWFYQIVQAGSLLPPEAEAFRKSARADKEEEVRTIGSATLASLDIDLNDVEIASSSSSSVYAKESRPQLEKETQDSLYKSVSDLLDPTPAKTAAPAMDMPRYQLQDEPMHTSSSSSSGGGGSTISARSIGIPIELERAPTLPPKTRLVHQHAVASSIAPSISTVGSSGSSEALPGVVSTALVPARVRARTVTRLLSKSSGSSLQDKDHSNVDMQAVRAQLEGISTQLRSQARSNSKQSGRNDHLQVADGIDAVLGLLVDKQTVPEAGNKARDVEMEMMRDQIKALMQAVEGLSSATNSPETQRTAAVPAAVPLFRPVAPPSPLPDELLDADAFRYGNMARQRTSVVPAVPKAPTSHRVAVPRAVERERESSSIATAGRIYAEREDAVARLEGSHPDLVYEADREVFLGRKREPKKQDANLLGRSAFSSDTISKPDTDFERFRIKLAQAYQPKPRKASKPLPVLTPTESAPSVRSSSPSEPPTPKARDFHRKVATEIPAANPASQIKLDDMHELLKTLVVAVQSIQQKSSKYDEMLQHQQQVSEYITHLNEFLKMDQHATLGTKLDTVRDEVAEVKKEVGQLPRELATLVQASVAIAGVQTAHEQASSSSDSGSAGAVPTQDPTPAPDTDGKPPKPPAASQAKAGGNSLLRRVSIGLQGGAPGAAGSIRVAGPRKLGGPRLFGHPPSATTDEARNRWNAGGLVRETSAPAATGAGFAEEHQAPAYAYAAGAPDKGDMVSALEGFREHLEAAAAAGEDVDGQKDLATNIALGIVEILKMLKAQAMRDEAKDHEKSFRRTRKEDQRAEMHAREIESIRAEIREWEARKAELEAANKDPNNQEGILTVIAILKDQMAQQEALLADLKDSVTPKLASLDEERTAAMHEVKEHALDNIEISRAKMDAEVKKAIEQVAELREQKKTLQSDLAELLSFKAKFAGGAPDRAGIRPGQGCPPMPGPASGAGRSHPGPAPGYPGYAPPTPDSGSSGSSPFMRARGPR